MMDLVEQVDSGVSRIPEHPGSELPFAAHAPRPLEALGISEG